MQGLLDAGVEGIVRVGNPHKTSDRLKPYFLGNLTEKVGMPGLWISPVGKSGHLPPGQAICWWRLLGFTHPYPYRLWQVRPVILNACHGRLLSLCILQATGRSMSVAFKRLEQAREVLKVLEGQVLALQSVDPRWG